MRSLSRLVVPCDLWSQLKYTILSTITSQDGRDGKVKVDTSLWGADMTIVQSLPVLWDVLGEHAYIVDPSTYSFNFPTQFPSIRLANTFDHKLLMGSCHTPTTGKNTLTHICVILSNSPFQEKLVVKWPNKQLVFPSPTKMLRLHVNWIVWCSPGTNFLNLYYSTTWMIISSLRGTRGVRMTKISPRQHTLQDPNPKPLLKNRKRKRKLRQKRPQQLLLLMRKLRMICLRILPCINISILQVKDSVGLAVNGKVLIKIRGPSPIFPTPPPPRHGG